MITTERQYRVTKTEANRLREAISNFDPIQVAAQGIDPIIVKAQQTALSEQLKDLERDLARYEQLKSGEAQRLTADSLIQLGDLLIQARIASQLSQRELADRLGMKEQQIQRYEQERYGTANLTRLEAVAAALAIRLDTQIEIGGAKPLTDLGFDPKQLPLRIMKKRGWLESYPDGRGETEISLAAEFIRQSGAGTRLRALHRQNVRSGSAPDEYALLAWKARILTKAREVEVGEFSEHIDINFIKQVVCASAELDGPVRAVRMLRDKGIAVVFESHLPKTHLDGAALLLENNIPVIGMTLRHDRLDNFWFVLMHELAHILKHRRRLTEGFFDELDDEADNNIGEEEREADQFAEEALISMEVWRSSFVRFTSSRDDVLRFAGQQNVNPAIVAGRIRNERRKSGGYRLFSDLVGRGEVRALMQRAGYLEAE